MFNDEMSYRWDEYQTLYTGCSKTLIMLKFVILYYKNSWSLCLKFGVVGIYIPLICLMSIFMFVIGIWRVL